LPSALSDTFRQIAQPRLEARQRGFQTRNGELNLAGLLGGLTEY
jgi:hypothetical protein